MMNFSVCDCLSFVMGRNGCPCTVSSRAPAQLLLAVVEPSTCYHTKLPTANWKPISTWWSYSKTVSCTVHSCSVSFDSFDLRQTVHLKLPANLSSSSAVFLVTGDMSLWRNLQNVWWTRGMAIRLWIYSNMVHVGVCNQKAFLPSSTICFNQQLRMGLLWVYTGTANITTLRESYSRVCRMETWSSQSYYNKVHFCN